MAEKPKPSLLQKARVRRGFTQEEAVEQLLRLAREDATFAGARVDASMLSKWERGRKRPSRPYRALLRALYSMTDEALGFSSDSEDAEQFSAGAVGTVDYADPFRSDQPELSTGLRDGFVALQSRVNRPRAVPYVENSNAIAMIDDLETLTAVYRRSYRQTAVRHLLPQAVNHLHAATTAMRDATSEGDSRRLVNVVAQTAMLVGTLLLHDRGDARTATEYYGLSHEATRQIADIELEAYLLGAMSFVSAQRGNRNEAVLVAQRACDLARGRASHLTRSWLHAVSAEMFALQGMERESLTALDCAEDALNEAPYSAAWIGIGSFDLAKLNGYRGTCNLRLRRHAEAKSFLSRSLDGLDSSCLKHRFTAQADLAATLIEMGEPESGAQLAIDVLDSASRTEHVMTARRIASVTGSLAALPRPPKVVGELQSRLLHLAYSGSSQMMTK